MPILRDGTFDWAIWSGIVREYPSLPAAFSPGEVVVDAGCHTGALCELAARRGATVHGYEANRENYALAVINLQQEPAVTLHHAAVWRSDLSEPVELVFTPSADTANTGGGAVLYRTAEEHWAVRPPEGFPGPADTALSTHLVRAVALDDVLAGLGPVRFLKLDVEGAEFPILLTAQRLDLVTTIAGEYHQFTDEQMEALDPAARVGDRRYTLDLLVECLDNAGFDVTHRPDSYGRGTFSAERR